MSVTRKDIAAGSNAQRRARGTRRARERDPRSSRYTLADGGFVPEGGLAIAVPGAALRNVDPTLALIEDPHNPAGPRQFAAVNRRVDLLEHELSQGTITASQHATGRQLQAVFERASGARLGGGFGGGGGGGDMVVRRELQVLYAIVDAQLVARLMARVQRAIGEAGADFLCDLLSSSQSIRAFAETRGKPGDRGRTAVGAQFRFLLGAVDDHFAAHGTLLDAVRAYRGELEGTATDERGRQVEGEGYRWGRRVDPSAAMRAMIQDSTGQGPQA